MKLLTFWRQNQTVGSTDIVYFPLYKVALTFKSIDGILVGDLQMKAIEKHFHVFPFIMLYKVVLTLESVEEIHCVSIQMKAFELYISLIMV